jgi:hypothetical protein
MEEMKAVQFSCFELRAISDRALLIVDTLRTVLIAMYSRSEKPDPRVLGICSRRVLPLTFFTS